MIETIFSVDGEEEVEPGTEEGGKEEGGEEVPSGEPQGRLDDGEKEEEGTGSGEDA
ncbi:MAG: hypothetical protein AAB524_01000 [Patescibacteria group bacterium]